MPKVCVEGSAGQNQKYFIRKFYKKRVIVQYSTTHLLGECVRMRKLRQASSHHEVVLHDLMLVTMRVLNRYRREIYGGVLSLYISVRNAGGWQNGTDNQRRRI